MSKKYNKYQEATLGNVIRRIVHDPIYRARWTLTFSVLWSIFLFAFYLAIGIVHTTKTADWSWYYGLSIWYLTFVVFKVILIINLFRRIMGKKWIDFKLLAAIFLFISFAETTFIAFTPAFFESVFINKLNKPLRIVNYVITGINILLFFLSFWPVKREEFTKNEADFLISKHYVSRIAGIFNWLIIIMNTLITFNVHISHAWVVGIVYFIVSIAFAIMCLVLAIKALVKRRWDRAHADANRKQAKK